ncbi:MAG TPA: hypothetical protein VFU15_09435, partial [Bacteroidia bacterium]|nr:hypothetical protein [Bacteroidia bacterium]
MNILFRKAGPDDAALLRRLAAEAFYNAYAKFNMETDMKMYMETYFTEERVQAEISDPHLYFL